MKQISILFLLVCIFNTLAFADEETTLGEEIAKGLAICYIASQLGIDSEIVDDLIYALKDYNENLSLKIIKQIDDQKKAISLLVGVWTIYPETRNTIIKILDRIGTVEDRFLTYWVMLDQLDRTEDEYMWWDILEKIVCELKKDRKACQRSVLEYLKTKMSTNPDAVLIGVQAYWFAFLEKPSDFTKVFSFMIKTLKQIDEDLSSTAVERVFLSSPIFVGNEEIEDMYLLSDILVAANDIQPLAVEQVGNLSFVQFKINGQPCAIVLVEPDLDVKIYLVITYQGLYHLISSDL